ncbi:hypothetical protein [Nocardiopsis sp. YSL2]|nr:hypothetical protein [Nocardiopsis sp. YSL2]
MNLLVTLLLIPGALALIWVLVRHLTGGSVLPDRDADLAFLQNRTEVDR